VHTNRRHSHARRKARTSSRNDG